MNELPRVDKEARRLLADAAKDLLTDHAFREAILALRKEYFGEVMALSTADSTFKIKQEELCAKCRALEEIPGRLKSFMLDYERVKRG